MFNENVKNDFIEYVSNTTIAGKDLIKRIFNYAEKHETKYNKDLCNWNLKEILDFYRELNLSSGLTLYNFNSNLKKYTSFCMDKNMVNDLINHYDEIDDELVFSCTNVAAESRIYSREDILYAIDSYLVNASDKLIILGTFEGLLGNDTKGFCQMTVDCISGNQVTIGDRTLEVSNELIQLIKESCAESEYLVYKGSDFYSKSYKDEDCDYAIKRTKGGVVVSGDNYNRFIYSRMPSIGKKMDDAYKFTTKSLENSGRIELMRKLIKETNCTIDEAIANKDIVYRYGKIHSKKLFKMKYPNILGEL